MLLSLLLRRSGAKRHHHILGMDRCIVGLWRDKRRMRAKKYKMGEPGSVSSDEQPLDKIISEEGCLVVGCGELSGNVSEAAIGRYLEVAARTEDIFSTLEVVALGKEVGDPSTHILWEMQGCDEAGHHTF